MAIPLVMGDKISGQCAIHMIPNPGTGAPQPAPPMPFSAPLLMGLVPTVTIAGKAVAVVGSSGINTPPHIGLHPAGDPFAIPSTQQGMVVTGSATVMAGGTPVATTDSQVTMCGQVPGMPVPSVATVTVG